MRAAYASDRRAARPGARVRPGEEARDATRSRRTSPPTASSRTRTRTRRNASRPGSRRRSATSSSRRTARAPGSASTAGCATSTDAAPGATLPVPVRNAVGPATNPPGAHDEATRPRARASPRCRRQPSARVPPASRTSPSSARRSRPRLLKPLPDVKGVVSWSTLAQVQPVKVKDRVVPQYADGVLKLNATEVKLQGFMMPLEMGDKQKQFVLTAMPQSCAFCLPGGPEQLVLVQAKAPVKYTMEPVILSGKLAVLKDDPNGLYYRLDDAVITTAEVSDAPSRAPLAPRACAGRRAARDPRACAVAPRRGAVRARRRDPPDRATIPASCLAFDAAARRRGRPVRRSRSAASRRRRRRPRLRRSAPSLPRARSLREPGAAVPLLICL